MTTSEHQALRYVLAAVFAVCSLVALTAWSAPSRPEVVLVRIEGTIDLGLAPFVARSLADAQKRGASAVVLDMDTLGGRLDAALAIRDKLLDSPLRTVAFVRRRAISAGALIAMAASKIAMAEGATIGAATPIRLQPSGESASVDEKTISYVRKEFKATAEKRGRSVEIAEAMVDPALEVSGLVEKGKLLTLTAREAQERGFIEYQKNDLQSLLSELGLRDASVLEVSPSWAERLVRFVTDTTLASILMSLGMLGLLIEIRTPGFGVPGIVGISCLALVFWGHYLARLAGAEELVLVLLGLSLLALEIFVIPGFGVTGIAGILSLSAGLVLSLLGSGVTSSAVIGATSRILVSVLAALGAFLLLSPLLPRLPFARRMILTSTLGSEIVVADLEQPRTMVGARGVSISPLRPSGIVAIGDTRCDAVTEGEYLDAGQAVEVIRTAGGRIVVKRVV